MKYTVPSTLTFIECETIREEIDRVGIKIKDKIAIEHNNVNTYIKDKERIVFDGNVHKYSHFLYELESGSLEMAQEYIKILKFKYNRLDTILMSYFLIAGEFGTWEGDKTDVKSHENIQNLLVKELVDRKQIDRLIEVIYSTKKNLYHEFYIQLHDAMLAARYTFHDKTIRKIASDLEYKLNLNFIKKPRKKDISDGVPLKIYSPR